MSKLIVTSLPVFVGMLLLYAATYKLITPGEATYAVTALNVPSAIASLTVGLVTAMELYLGLLLVLRVDLKYSLAVTAVLLLAFTGFLWYLLTLAHSPACGCLGLTGIFNTTKHAAIFGIFRNCMLLWAIWLSYNYHQSAPFKAAAIASLQGPLDVRDSDARAKTT
jgi:hypothetical protein